MVKSIQMKTLHCKIYTTMYGLLYWKQLSGSQHKRGIASVRVFIVTLGPISNKNVIGTFLRESKSARFDSWIENLTNMKLLSDDIENQEIFFHSFFALLRIYELQWYRQSSFNPVWHGTGHFYPFVFARLDFVADFFSKISKLFWRRKLR